MNVIGSKLTVVDSTDPTKRGRTGTVVMETMKTLILQAGGRKITVEKTGSAFSVEGSKAHIRGEELAGRLEDRLGGRKR